MEARVIRWLSQVYWRETGPAGFDIAECITSFLRGEKYLAVENVRAFIYVKRLSFWPFVELYPIEFAWLHIPQRITSQMTTNHISTTYIFANISHNSQANFAEYYKIRIQINMLEVWLLISNNTSRRIGQNY